MCPVGWEYATRIDAESPCYTERFSRMPRSSRAAAATEAAEEPVDADDALQRREPPAGWTRSRSGSWEGWTPPRWVPRLQGWKIHVSATRQDAVAILQATTAICVDGEVAFKFLPTVADLWMANAKHADRASAGKFVTVYPRDDAQLAVLLGRLESSLVGKAGPFILSDLRVGQAPVYVRYGGIYPLTYRDQLDTSIAALVTGPALALTEDLRQPSFTLPDGVALPECLREPWARHRQDIASPIDRYARIEALGFSNAGGVYLATLPDGTRHVLREARPHAGWDAAGRSAVERQLHEERVLRDLRGVPGVQQLRESFTAWEHRFLVLDYLEGTPLVKWSAAHYPLHYVDRQDDPDQIAAYAERATSVVTQLCTIIESVHELGWCVGDLHPGNVLIDDDGRVGLLDLEDATPIHAPRDIGMRMVEYCAPEGFTARQADWYAAARIAMNLYVTGWPAEVICPESWTRCVDLVRDRMGTRAAAQIEDLDRRTRGTGPTGNGREIRRTIRHTLSPRVVAEPAPAQPAPLRTVIDQLVSFTDWSTRYSATGGYPGDPVLGGRLPWASYEAGLAGVIWARARIGRPVEPHVVDRLATVTEVLSGDGPVGLHQGLAGMALALHEQDRYEPGRADRAAAVLAICLDRVEESRRRDLAHGRAGVLLAALEVAADIGDAGLLRRVVRAYRRFAAEEPPPAVDKPGVLFGESGIAVLDLMLAHHTGDEQALEAGLARIRRDAAQCEPAADGTCLVTDVEGNRMLPYLEWGSAGVLAAANLAALFSDAELLDATSTAGILHACSSRMYVYDGFHHGRAGILAALLTAGPAGASAADFQAHQLAANLPVIAGHRAVVGDGLIRLSADLATGAAGVALVLHCYATGRPFGWLPVANGTSEALTPVGTAGLVGTTGLPGTPAGSARPAAAPLVLA